MKHVASLDLSSASTSAGVVGHDTSAPGERYFRHPGDVVRFTLAAVAVALLVLFVELATRTSAGVSSDLSRAASAVPDEMRELLLAAAQLVALVVPVLIVAALVYRRRWRRLGVVTLAAAAGGAVFALLDLAFDIGGHVPDAVTGDTWIASADFPSLTYVAGAAAVGIAGAPWLSRSWRRCAAFTFLGVVAVLAVAGTVGVPELLLALATGVMAGAAVLIAVGAPNRRPAPAVVVVALRDAGLAVDRLALERADGGRAQLYTATLDDGGRAFVKVYARDSRDADLLYRSYRTLLLRGPNDDRPALSLGQDVEHEALLLLIAQRADVTCPRLEVLTALPDGSMALAVEYVDGMPLDALEPEAIDDALLDAVWRHVQGLHAARLAHRSLRAANILVSGANPVIIDLGFGTESAEPRTQAIDRAELLVSLATLVGVERALASGVRTLGPHELATAAPYLQPLALSAATRKQANKTLLRDLRVGIADATGETPAPLEQLVRVRARTLVTIAALTAAFYVLLPQLADVGDSVDALGSADFWWLGVCLVMSVGTYVGAAIGLSGGVPEHLPFGPNLAAQLASSFVNRVTPANVGGMALNLRFLQKAGVAPAEAVTGIGLNVAAGGLAHLVLFVMFVAWAGHGDSNSFQIPSSSKLLVAIAVVLAVVGLVALTRWGRRMLRTRVLTFLKQSVHTVVVLAHSPAKIIALVGGSFAISIAYICALAAAVAAFDGGVTFAQVGAVYLGASVIAAAAPTPGGLGAMEAALVAGLTGVGMEPSIAVAAVLSYRLLTYWLPVLPGWLCFHYLERRDFI
jgi:glycosyltransferase 2 family protein